MCQINLLFSKNKRTYFRALPKEIKEATPDEIVSDMTNLGDESLSLAESLTDMQVSNADAPPRIPLGGIRERLLAVRTTFKTFTNFLT